MEDFSIFNHAKIDYIFMPSKILINKTANALINPLSDKFIQILSTKDEIWAKDLLHQLIKNININPKLYELTINNKETPQIYNGLKNKQIIKLHLLKISLRNNNMSNNALPLFLIKENNESILLPSWDEDIHINDQILFACDENAIDDMEYICQNINEFNYALGTY